ncbi:putative F-box/LRR-repeat protein At5g02700 isoform X2 [Telopea speciosissima]|uniref:putative F-box/LRR-repeat protein At5g02700 isoform X2 n=1 Tax=Telopea speciosissima TaxID=54955 RepID=UPI001CC6F449|nr:putative F-box/LRR-repeat protein At5g02700 isoform X2 [Telopea speciosissima]
MEEQKKRRRTEETCYDRITNLPEAVLRHIISFLPTEDAMKTSVLSKRWRYLWTCIPVLDFDEYFFSDQKALMDFYMAVEQQKKAHYYGLLEELRNFDYDLSRLYKQKKIFVDFVDRALLLHEGKTIQELRITFRSFSAKLLKVLTLQFCVFRPLDYKSFPSMEKVVLTQVKLPDASVQDLVSHSPCLKFLRLEKCCLPTDFVIYVPTSNLQWLYVDSCLCYMDDVYMITFCNCHEKHVLLLMCLPGYADKRWSRWATTKFAFST